MKSRKRRDYKAAPLDNPPLRDLCADARQAWLSATEQSHLDYAEKLYRVFLVRALKRQNEGSDPPSDREGDDAVEEARKRLFLLLCQAGKDHEVAPRMRRKGFTARLARGILNYTEAPLLAYNKTKSTFVPCAVFDNVLPSSALEALVNVFCPVDANYWNAHGYCVEPPTPFFSYVLPMAEANSYGAMGILAMAVKAHAKEHFGDKVDRSVYAEFWAHNRPHACGHQMHFDSDDEGRNGIRNPLAGSIFYLGADGLGGPSLVTDQPFGAQQLARCGWFCWPKKNRLVVFDGTMLHGVIPGKGFVSDLTKRRVTLMVALWETIKVRPGVGPGSARPLPSKVETRTTHQWLRDLCECNHGHGKITKATRMMPQTVAPVWETISGEPWDHLTMGMPAYDAAFQGF